MRSRLPIREDLLASVDRLATAAGRSPEIEALRLLALGLLDRLAADLAPLLRNEGAPPPPTPPKWEPTATDGSP